MTVSTHLQYPENALQSPIAFAQVREDSQQDSTIIQRCYSEEKISVLMVASGGCTAAKLISEASIKELKIVDPNPAQLHLTELKLQLVHLPKEKRMQLLGHLPMPKEERLKMMRGMMIALDIPEDAFGHLEEVAKTGLDHAGRYEKVFSELRRCLQPHQDEIEALFTLNDSAEQMRRVAPDTPLGKALDTAFDAAFAQDHLVAIFGEEATANRAQDFSRHFAERTRTYLSTHLAKTSPYLAQMLLGHFHGETVYPWLEVDSPAPDAKISFVNSTMNQALEEAAPQSYDVIHLSNIIDWLSPEEGQRTLALAYQALKPGGCVIIRQLNSNANIPQMGTSFQWNTETAQELHAEDHSFFYRGFFVGEKPRTALAPQVQSLADAALQEQGILQSPYFTALNSGKMSLEQFRQTQEQFFFAVDFFSRPMAALIARLPLHRQRLDILHNIVEEHGDFDPNDYHSSTFKKFLQQMGSDLDWLTSQTPGPEAHAFNCTLMGACSCEDPLTGVAAVGIIEYAFADISAHIGQAVIAQKWAKKDSLFHYNLHAELDKRHAEEFFVILEPHITDPAKKETILAGLKLGAYIFDRLYRDLYKSLTIM